MPSPRLEQAAKLVTLVGAAFTDAGLDKATATTNALHVTSGARHGIAVIAPPSLTFPDWDAPAVEWTVHLVAGPANDFLASWEKLDALLEALFAAQLNLKSAEPAGYETREGTVIPAYTVTLNPLD